jgi:hypothetical protein
MCAPDVIVAWLQHDYGQLGRPSEAIGHALVRSPEIGRVAYVEPFVAAAEVRAAPADVLAVAAGAVVASDGSATCC